MNNCLQNCLWLYQRAAVALVSGLTILSFMSNLAALFLTEVVSTLIPSTEPLMLVGSFIPSFH